MTNKEWRLGRKQSGLCYNCTNRTSNGKSYCNDCLAKYREYQQNNKEKNKERQKFYRQQRLNKAKQENLCVRCLKSEPAKNSNKCYDCAYKHSQYTKQYYLKNKSL